MLTVMYVFRETPLMEAARNKQPDVTSLLIQHGCDVHAVEGENKRTALHWSAESGDVGSALALIQAGAHVDVTNKNK